MIRVTKSTDANKILALYQETAKVSVGLARTVDEINSSYISDFIERSLDGGLSLVAVKESKVIAEIHAYPPNLKVFQHIFSDLTICVHPHFQGDKIGRALFQQFIDIVTYKMPHILRVELFARESNLKAINFYKTMGFKKEGCFKNRINSKSDTFENDIAMAWLR